MIKPLGVLLVLVIVGVVVLLLPIVVWGIVRIAQARGRRAAVVSGIAALAMAGLGVWPLHAATLKLLTRTSGEDAAVIKPIGTILALGVVGVLIVIVPFVIGDLMKIARARGRRVTLISGIAALLIAGLCVWAVYAVAPKGSRTIAQLNLPDGHALVLRHYRHGWFDYPKVRLYARDADGTWTSFAIIAELVNPNTPSLLYDEVDKEVDLPGVGWYRPDLNAFVHIDGGWANARELPPGLQPDEDDVR